MDPELEDLSEDLPKPRTNNHTVELELARMMTPMNYGVDLDQSWRDEALCADMALEDPYFLDLWFAPEDTIAASTAASTCFSCPSRVGCLEWSSRTKQRYGIFGGLPASIRLKGSPHDFPVLVELPDPYTTENPRNKFHVSKLTTWEPDEESDFYGPGI